MGAQEPSKGRLAMLWRLRTRLVIPAIAAVGAAAVSILACEVKRAPFRLDVQTASLWAIVSRNPAAGSGQATGDNRVAFESTGWIVDQPEAAHEWRDLRGKVVSLRSADPRQGRSYRVIFQLRPGEQIQLEMSDVIPPSTSRSLRVKFPKHPVDVIIETATGPQGPDFRFDVESTFGETRQEIGDRVDISVGGASGGSVRLEGVTTPRERTNRLRIEGIGFVQDEGVPRSGVETGRLYFLDTPGSEMNIFRGTDLRLESDDMTIESLFVTDKGLQVTLSGMASAAMIQLGSSGDDSAISIMPTYFDRAQRRPSLVAGIAALTLVSTLLGTVFAAGAIFDGVARRIGAKPPE